MGGEFTVTNISLEKDFLANVLINYFGRPQLESRFVGDSNVLASSPLVGSFPESQSRNETVSLLLILRWRCTCSPSQRSVSP